MSMVTAMAKPQQQSLSVTVANRNYICMDCKCVTHNPRVYCKKITTVDGIIDSGGDTHALPFGGRLRKLLFHVATADVEALKAAISSKLWRSLSVLDNFDTNPSNYHK